MGFTLEYLKDGTVKGSLNLIEEIEAANSTTGPPIQAANPLDELVPRKESKEKQEDLGTTAA
jgi:hypothetical protein